jgi:ribosomal protein S18 acetylase RimI-like enzyme
MSGAFAAIGWNKPVEMYQRYVAQQERDERPVLVAFVGGEFAGYVTVVWKPHYSAFPEIQDLNVLPQFRRRRIATALVDEAEALIGTRSDWVGIGVGMYSDYGPAQRMYVLRGYVPDGRGLTYRDHTVAPMEQVTVDDDLVLFFSKRLR